MIDRLSLTNKLGDIFEGSVKGYISSINTPILTSGSKRFLVLWVEYNLQEDTSELVLTELYSNNITFESKVFDKFSNNKLVEVSSSNGASTIKYDERFSALPITTTSIDAVPLDSPVSGTNKGHLGIGEEYANSITIGNRANDTLTEVLSRFGVRNDNDFLGQFSMADLTEDIVFNFPNNAVAGEININDWDYIFNTPTTLEGYGITDFDDTFDARFAAKIATEVVFGSNIIVEGFRTNENAFFYANTVLYGDILDKNNYAGATGKILTPASGGGVEWVGIDWDYITNKDSTYNPSAHFHTIGDVTDLSTALAGKQPLSADLTAIDAISGTTGLLKKTAADTWVLDTTAYLSANQTINITGDATGSGTTSIVLTLATVATAGTYRSVTVDAKGRVTSGTNPTTIAEYGITDFNDTFDIQWAAKIRSHITFESSILVEDYLSVVGSFYVNANLYDKNGVEGTANQVLMPITGGVAWTSLSTAQISDFSANVLGQVLTGYTLGTNTDLSSSNTILTAFQNLEAKVNSKAATLSGTTNYLSKFTSSSAIGNSVIFDDGTNVGIGTVSPVKRLTVVSPSGDYGQHILGSGGAGNNYGIIIDAGLNSFDWTVRVRSATTAEYFAIRGDGNIGMGTATPNKKLVVNGEIGFAYTDGYAYNGVKISSDNLGVEFYNIITSGSGNNSYRFSDHTGAYKVVIQNGGNVGIGTTSPAYLLDVNGTGHFTGAVLFDAIPSTPITATSAYHLVNLATVQSLVSAGFSVSTTCVLAFTTDQSLSGSKTQGGYTTVTNDSILLAGQSTASANGIYIFDGTNWARNTANDTDPEIRGKGHLITDGTFANTQWVNNNSSSISMGFTAITYVQWSGAELDPVFTAHAAFNVTNTKISNWDSAYGWGNHAGLYVDKTSAQTDIAGAKTFTTSIRSNTVTPFIPLPNNNSSSSSNHQTRRLLISIQFNRFRLQAH